MQGVGAIDKLTAAARDFYTGDHSIISDNTSHLSVYNDVKVAPLEKFGRKVRVSRTVTLSSPRIRLKPTYQSLVEKCCTCIYFRLTNANGFTAVVVLNKRHFVKLLDCFEDPFVRISVVA
jgi:hypothetical protein